MRRKNPTEELIVTVAALLAAAGVGIYILTRPPALAPAPAATTPPAPMTPQVVIVVPGTMQITGGQASGYYATLPNGGQWLNQNGNTIGPTLAGPNVFPILISGLGAQSQTFTWLDSTGGTQTTNIFST